ncbi:MAG: prephenate dehydrogenase dimerization domain-containing protein, partial [Verrucomicrobiota bacterium]
RIASGDPQLWKEIIQQNRPEILRALGEFQDELQAFRSAIANQNDFEVLKRLADAKAFRDSL